MIDTVSVFTLLQGAVLFLSLAAGTVSYALCWYSVKIQCAVQCFGSVCSAVQCAVLYSILVQLACKVYCAVFWYSVMYSILVLYAGAVCCPLHCSVGMQSSSLSLVFRASVAEAEKDEGAIYCSSGNHTMLLFPLFKSKGAEKLDGVGPVDMRLSLYQLQQFVKKKKYT